MFKRMNRRVTAGLMAIAIVLAQVISVAPAFATNKGTASGDKSTGCAVNWNAESMMTTDATQYPSDLLIDMSGNPVSGGTGGGNGGYITEVSPIFGSKGRMEIQHYYIGSAASHNLTANFRIFIGSDQVINNGALTMSLPADYTWSVSDGTAWGAQYATTNNLPYVNQGKYTQPGASTFNVSLGANQEIVIIFTAAVPNNTDVLKASAQLTGTYTMSQGCESTIPDAPAINPVGPCEFATYGRTSRLLGTSDISTREKFDQNGALITSTTPSEGEINADGFDNQYRLYAATKTALTNVRLTWLPTQGFHFTPGSVGTIRTGDDGKGNSSMGALYNNGYTVAVPNAATLTPVINADGSITVTIPSMPAHSAIAFSTRFTLDGSASTMAMNETMFGDRESCPGTISGTVYWDNDVNKTISDGDNPYTGKIVYLVDQTTGETIAETTTDADGNYTFADVTPGNYTVMVIPVSGGEQPSTPAQIADVTVARGQDVTDVSFGLYKPGKGDATPPVVTPVVPAPAVTPAVAVTTILPAELPHTGPNDTYGIQGLIVSLAAAIATYGAVFFAQPKRR